MRKEIPKMLRRVEQKEEIPNSVNTIKLLYLRTLLSLDFCLYEKINVLLVQIHLNWVFGYSQLNAS